MGDASAAMDLMPRLEKELSAPVVAHYRALGHRVDVEVAFNGRIADVIAVADSGDITSVELKLRDWRTALRQAVAYQVACHASFVALPLSTVLRYHSKVGFLAAFRESGCGLLAVNHPLGDVREIVPALPSRRRLDYLGDAVAGAVTGPHEAGEPASFK